MSQVQSGVFRTNSIFCWKFQCMKWILLFARMLYHSPSSLLSPSSHHHDHHHLHSACSVNCCSQVIAGSSSAVHWRLGRAVQTGVPQVWHVWQTRPHLCCAIDVTIFAQTIHCPPPLAWKGLTWEEGPETSSAFAAYFTLPRAVSTKGGRYGTVQKLFLSDASTIIGYPCHSLTHLPN